MEPYNQLEDACDAPSYVNYQRGCRCRACTVARSAYQRQYASRPHVRARMNAQRAVRRREYAANPNPENCGTQYGYSLGCRCDPCTAAQSAYMREYKARKAAGLVKPRHADRTQDAVRQAAYKADILVWRDVKKRASAERRAAKRAHKERIQAERAERTRAGLAELDRAAATERLI
jgi:hypothetical protein